MSLENIGQGLWSAIRAAINDNFSELDGRAHDHANKAILDDTTASFTVAEKTKLANLSERFRGAFSDLASAEAAITNPVTGNYFLNAETATVWLYQESTENAGEFEWVDLGIGSAGDMIASLYDPQGIGADAFDRANHTGTIAQADVTDLVNTIDDLTSRLEAIETDYDNVKAVTVDSGAPVLLAVGAAHSNGSITHKFSRSGSGTSTLSAKLGHDSDASTGQGYRNMTLSGYAPDGETYSQVWHLATPSSERDNILTVYNADVNSASLPTDGSDITFRLYSIDDSAWDDPTNNDTDDQAVTIAIYGILA